ncbi:MAG TPA: sigma-54 dependent transcriptional regulator [Candidatus Sulfotelmatobacter sp.]|nr:sigma-54 dependent transcriptional regulator [Candidatus Sulfotelmatobacter sp.]
MSTQGKLLIVDDELSVRDSLGKWFREEGYEVATTENASDALTRLAEQRWDAALVDIKMHGTDGIELQRRMHEVDPELIVIMMTGYASVETAVTALKNGAYDYVTKPLDPDEIAHLVKNALAHKRTEQENVLLRETVAEVTRPGDLIGQSTAMRKIFDAIETVGPTDATVLITSESGTGKELLARAIHQASPRKFHPLVVIHCGALTETLLESELFGHEKGAFTGAQYRKKGKFEIAEGGTVFLDEIGDISLKTQTDLLRVLQEREITRVGGNQIIKVDFRCIAATNKDLEKLIEEGKFRPDLFYRLNVFRIELPPLRDRREDIPLLVDHFVRKLSLAMNKRITRVSPAAMNLLQQQPWLGNVRELENAVERAMVVGQEPELKEQDFIFKSPTGSSSNGASKSLEDIERGHILRVVEECGGNQSRAAELLDIDRVTLYHKLKKYGWTRASVDREKKPDEVAR